MKKTKEDRDTRIQEYLSQWTEEEVSQFQADFLAWYDQHQRDLPWRRRQDPYAIWVSEIMLQQTQVKTVIPYFNRFMSWFEEVSDLAEAPEEKLLKAWEGLGYYSRVRNMQVAAKQIMTEFSGEMPTDIKDIQSLKGIGPYTSGAIASIAFNQPEPAVDGNVMRVFSRLFKITEDISKPATRHVFEGVVRQVISQKDPSSFNQAIMDLGASICTPTKPVCEACPLSAYCEAFKEGNMTEYPVKLGKVKTIPEYYIALVLIDENGKMCLTRRKKHGLLGNFWTFPLVSVSKEIYQEMQQQWASEPKTYLEKEQGQLSFLNVAETTTLFEEQLEQLGIEGQFKPWPIGEVTHVFSHRKWHLLMAQGTMLSNQVLDVEEETQWVHPKEFSTYAFPKPQQKMLEVLTKNKIISNG